ncbi:ABC exporter membrane fusion protein [Stenomitos frigidus]|uniref:HlyD family secretion protein n=1 Tax=Stenomitos frigidus ULC18 TaxID=2107698 RepID=A0A2T1ENN3_9CYAN|nr:ABC exporter membrane fusion protein [Stenomitos frigidus]PSB34344.1 HlyD family secretion protein [Stenomitos frigidus ULC18]
MQTVTSKTTAVSKPLSKLTQRRVLVVAALGGMIATGCLLYGASYFSLASQKAISAVPVSTKATRVTALGRLEPQGEVIQLAASSKGSRVEQLLVQRGDRVRAGQVIAVLDSRDRLQAALEKAKQDVQIAFTKLAQVKAGAKTGEIGAQSATIARLNAELNNAQLEAQRYQTLYEQGAISASSRDSKQLVADTTRAQLQQAKNTLSSVAEIRPVDVTAAEAEVASAQTVVKQAQADLALALVRSPRDGQVLKVHTWAGEIVGDQGIVDLGQTDQMYVVAEVYESDVKDVRMGQPATITSSAFNGDVHGTVKEIGLQIQKKGVLDTNPTADADARIVEVKIRLDKPGSRKVAGLTNLEVTVQIAKEAT